MPIYTYICDAGHKIDERARYGDGSSRTCPICGKEALRQSVYHIVARCTEEANRNLSQSYLKEEMDNKTIKISKFQEAAAELDYEHKKLEESLQREIPTPDYFHEGYRQGYAIASGKRGPTKEKF